MAQVVTPFQEHPVGPGRALSARSEPALQGRPPADRGQPRRVFGHFLDVWSTRPGATPADVRAEYLRACRDAIASIVADYRATATVDIGHDRADLDIGNRLTMPVTVVQQDWGRQLGFNAAAIWRPWTTDLQHFTTLAGHFMAEEAPQDIAALILELARR